MSTGTADYVEAVSELGHGQRLTFSGVDWDDYERLVDRLGDDYHVRVSYSEGRLEIMGPSNKHEKIKGLINRLVTITCYELDLRWLSLGSVTLKKRALRRGAEADDCFYFAAVGTIIRQDTLDLATDPVPDIVVEVDLSSQSTRKLQIYASFGVLEVWRYRKGGLEILKLSDNDYQSVSASQFLPLITAERITQYIADCESGGDLEAQHALREWLRTRNN